MSQSQSQSSLIHTLLNIYVLKTAAHNLELSFFMYLASSVRGRVICSATVALLLSMTRTLLSILSFYVHKRIPGFLITVNRATLTLRKGYIEQKSEKGQHFL